MLAAVPGCSRQQATSGPIANSTVDAKQPGKDLLVAAPIRHGNLSIFPVVSRVAKNDDRFITLDLGLKDGTVEIMEIGGNVGNQPTVGNNVPSISAAALQSNTPQSQAADPQTRSVTPRAMWKWQRTLRSRAIPLMMIQPPVIHLLAIRLANQVRLRRDQIADSDPFGGSLASAQQAVGNGNQVNKLLVTNRSTKSLYLMPGEIIIGGQQDRVIGEEIVVQPGTTPVPIQVFCVEHGRWNNRDVAQTAGYLAATSLVVSQTRDDEPGWADPDTRNEILQQRAAEANSGKFVASIGNVNKASRLAVQVSQSQSAVWDEVAAQN